MKEFDETYYRNIISGRLFYHSARDVFDYLNQNNYPYAVVKGEVLSIQAYNAAGQRSYSDVDILILKKDIPKICAYLKELGYCNKIDNPTLTAEQRRFSEIYFLSTSHQYLPFHKQFKNYSLEIDLNFDVFWGEYDGERLDIQSCFLNDTIMMDIYQCSIKCLTPIKSLIHFALHNYKDMNSVYLLAKGNSNKSHMMDLYYLLKNHASSITVESLYSLSHSYKILPYMYYVFYFLKQYHPDPFLDPYIDAFRTADGDDLIDCYGLNRKERRKWELTVTQRMGEIDTADYIESHLTDQERKKIKLNKLYFG